MSLRFDSVTHRYGRRLALDEVSIHVRRGDCYGLIGHNGAGKTTAIRIALGLLRPTHGRVVVDGIDVGRNVHAAHSRLGGLVETPGFRVAASGSHNLRALARLQGLGPREADREAGRVLDLVALDEGPKPVRDYSQGMRQRLGLAQALLGGPAYLLLDEPTNGVDPEGTIEFRNVLRRLVAGGTTILISSHQLQELAGLCNRIGIQKQGRLLVEDETAVLLRDARRRFEVDLRSGGSEPRPVLDRLGVSCEPLPDGRLAVDLVDRAPDEVLRALVEAGGRVLSFAPEPANLERVYMSYGAGDAQVRAPAPEAISVEARRHTLSPRAIARVARWELGRMSWRGALLLLLPPSLLAAAAVWSRYGRAAAHAREVAAKSLASTTDVTAFEGVAIALQAGLPLLVCFVAGVASQSIAAELASGTLRNVLMRPVRRVEVALGKTAGVLVLVVGALLVLTGTAFAAASLCFDFGDVVEVLPGGRSFPLVPAAELWPQLWPAVAAPFLPLATYAGIGFLCGALVRGPAAALALAVSGVVFLDLIRVVGRGFGFEGWLPSAYLPSPLGDTSLLQCFAEASRGVSNVTFRHAATQVVAPLTWCVLTFAAAAWALGKKSVR